MTGPRAMAGLARAAARAVAAFAAFAAFAVAGVAGVLAAPAFASTATAAAGTGPPRPVVLVGIAGLRWADVSPRATPNLWRLAGGGSPGTLVDRAVLPHTCAADDWLTLNAGARAMVRHANKGQCPPVPAPSALPALAAGPGGCVTAAGPGAALALAGAKGAAPAQVPVSRVSRSVSGGCPLTVVDLGTVTAVGARATALSSADAELGRIAAAMPSGGLLAVAGLADGGTPHLQVAVVSGPGYLPGRPGGLRGGGLLAAASTRQPGLVQLTDLTAAILAWRHQSAPADLVGSPLTSSGRGSLAGAAAGLAGQDTAAQVYRSSSGWFFAV